MDSTKKGYSDKQFYILNVKSDIIKKMAQDSDISQSDLAEYLNCTISSLRNKFSRDSFSLYDFIVICHVCGYSLSIHNGSIDDDLSTDKDCIDAVCENLRNASEEDDMDLVLDALDEAEVAQERLELYECVFDLSPENILTKEECNRINIIEDNKRKNKYQKIINGLSESEQLTLFEMLKDKQEKK